MNGKHAAAAAAAAAVALSALVTTDVSSNAVTSPRITSPAAVSYVHCAATIRRQTRYANGALKLGSAVVNAGKFPR